MCALRIPRVTLDVGVRLFVVIARSWRIGRVIAVRGERGGRFFGFDAVLHFSISTPVFSAYDFRMLPYVFLSTFRVLFEFQAQM